MERSLFFKLLGAFALVIVVFAVVATVLAKQATAGEFRTYTDRYGQVWAQHLAPALADFYSQNNSWEGVNGMPQDPIVWATSIGMAPSSPLSALPPSTITPLPQPDLSPDSAIAAPEAAPVEPRMRRGGMGRGMMGMSATATPVPGQAQSAGAGGSGPVETRAERGRTGRIDPQGDGAPVPQRPGAWCGDQHRNISGLQ